MENSNQVTIVTLTSETEKLGNRILADLENFLVELDGNLKDIDNGILIKIPLGAGYVKFWTSATDYSTTIWLTETVTKEQLDSKNLNDEE